MEVLETITREKECIRCGATFTATMEKLALLGWPERPSEFKRRKEHCPDCKQKLRDEMAEKSKNAVLGWTDFDAVKEHFKENPPQKGDPLIIASFQYHTNEYLRVYVEVPEHTRQKRIIVNRGSTYGGSSFYRSGQSTYHPKGQTRLLPDHPVMSELFKAFGGRLSLTDDALAAVSRGEGIESFEKDRLGVVSLKKPKP